MSRSGIQEAWGCDEREQAEEYELIIKEQIEGDGGQKFLRALLNALDNMEDKRLWVEDFENAEGGFCALGALANAQVLALSDYEPNASFVKVGKLFGICSSLPRFVAYLNDSYFVEDYNVVRDAQGFERYVKNENAETERWQKMREWALENLKEQK